MERLTIKKEYRTNIRYYKPKNVLVSDLTFKLGNLENIEEKLGIDLITLFKALKSGIYLKGNEFSVPVHLMKKWGTNEFILENGYKSPSWYYFKDYGKIWALTREELICKKD